MIRQLHKYLARIERDGSVARDGVALLVRDDTVLEGGAEELRALGRTVFAELGAIALVVARPWLPLQQLIPDRTPAGVSGLVPLDTETRTFLHDIPLVRSTGGGIDTAQIVAGLGRRKGVLVEGVGIVAAGGMTVEQAYINFSSIYHALFVSYLLQLLQTPPSAAEMTALAPLLAQLEQPIALQVDDLATGATRDKQAALQALEEIGRRTVELRLVDSFFGNVSCNLGAELLISQTGASLDELGGCIDLVPHDDSSTAGLTASSELAAHRAIYQHTGAAVILHGHPKFSVILSLLCDEPGCTIRNCWQDCPRVRYVGSVPVVAGEVGAGGIAVTLPPVMTGGIAIVYGHGVFATGQSDFRQPLQALVELENHCRSAYLRRLQQAVAEQGGRAG